MICSCGCLISSNPSNHAKHLKTQKHLRGGKVSYECTPCGMTFTKKGNFTDHCDCEMHKAKAWGYHSFDELGDISAVVQKNETSHDGLRRMKEMVLLHYFKRASAFMVSPKSEVVHVFKKTWREMPVRDFMEQLDFLVNEALEGSGVKPKYLEHILEDGHTKDGRVSKQHIFWCKNELADIFDKMTKKTAPVRTFVEEPEQPEEPKRSTKEPKQRSEEPKDADEKRPAKQLERPAKQPKQSAEQPKEPEGAEQPANEPFECSDSEEEVECEEVNGDVLQARRKLAEYERREKVLAAEFEEYNDSLRALSAAALQENIQYIQRTFEHAWEIEEKIAQETSQNAKKLKEMLASAENDGDAQALKEIRKKIASQHKIIKKYK